jgi:hypothetical protein
VWAAWAALVAAVGAGLAGLFLWRTGVVGGVAGALFVPAAAHGVVLATALLRFVRAGAPEGRIDALLVNVLLFTLWFAVLPLAHAFR